MKHYQTLQINTDGGSRGNPGPSAIGVVCSENDNLVFELSDYIGITTNNVAEYTAVIKALDYIQNEEITAQKLNFVLDSELIVKQILKLYKIKQPHLLALSEQVHEKIKSLKSLKKIHEVSFTHVLREKNKQADLLVNKSLDSQ